MHSKTLLTLTISYSEGATELISGGKGFFCLGKQDQSITLMKGKVLSVWRTE